jgi:ABC-2 type transport system permease protein
MAEGRPGQRRAGGGARLSCLAVIDAATELYGSRELLRNFVSRDLRARYKGSVLGIVWSLLNPLCMMLIYGIVFSFVNRGGPVRYFSLWFMAGYLPWIFFQTSLQMGASSLLAHAGLLQKVYFPREVLPMSQTLANLVNLGIAMAVLLPIEWAVVGFTPVGMAELVVVTVALLGFALGLTLLISAATVYFRDIEFLLGLVLMAWFFLTPVVFPSSIYPQRYAWVFRLNPMTPFIDAYREAIYDVHRVPLATLGITVAIGAVGFLAGYAVFNRLKHRIVEEL